MYEYRARVIHVVDGDTVDMAVDLGFGIAKTMRFRVLGINAPELRGASRIRGELATERLRVLLAESHDGTVLVLTVKDKQEKYGRYLARIIVQTASGDTLDVGERLIAEGLAISYAG
jgi:micrococcal nuclease